MNTNLLRKFAQETRIRLLEAVKDKLNYILNGDSAGLRDYADAIQTLKKDIKSMGEEALIDKVAYTWFNRLMALRFMDVNDYQPLGLKVISPKPGHTQPELLDEATQGHIPEDLKVDRERIHDLLDGNIDVLHPQNEVYRMLLIASCNYLNGLFPFLFEKIGDYTELLLPDDLISELSILQDFVKGMTEEDCQEVEVLGWLYQFYISELNNELISSKRVYKKNEIAPASQLFTPKWIVKYMVDNTLGQVWAEMNPSTQILKDLEFYITPSHKDKVIRKEKPIEEIKFLEPCVGSGHILAYAFDVFYMMYEEVGYAPSEIPILILQNNLFGIDIDPRATQIATFTLLMKGREKHRRFFRKIKKENFTPHIYYYEDFPQDPKFNNATALGSLIRVTEEETDLVEIDESSLFGKKQQKLKDLYQLLSRKYDVVVTNPPYISSKRMESSLKKYVNQTYPETKSDLFACFILQCLELTNENGLTGYMTPFVWMFIVSYQSIRKTIIENHFINNLVQLEYSGFDGATVPICTFTLRKNPLEGKGSYIRLSDFRGSQNQAPKTLEAIQNPDCGWFYTADQKDFEKIPGNNIGYWLNKSFINLFNNTKNIGTITESEGQTKTGNNDKFLRNLWEIDIRKFGKNKKWVLHPKGGGFRRWDGNLDTVIDWSEKARNHYQKDRVARIFAYRLWWKRGISWTLITAGKQSFRSYDDRSIFNLAAPTLFFKNEDERVFCLGLLNSKISELILKLLNPTLNCNIGEVQSIPIIKREVEKIKSLTNCNIEISKTEWNSRETSWDFTNNELIRMKGQDIKEAIELYKAYWTKKFIQLHRNEEELNARFIEIYGLQEELTPDVPLDEITILRDELDQRKLKKISGEFSSNWRLVDGVSAIRRDGEGSEEESAISHQSPVANPYPPLPFDEKELVKQFISYAVGCMMGRYSLEKPGLILANQGETISDYVRIVDGGQWTVSRPQDEMVDGEDENKNKSYDTGLQGSADMAAEHGFGEDGLSGDGKDAEGRAVQSEEFSEKEDENQPLITKNQSPFVPDDDGIIPVLDSEWFEDDIVTQFRNFVRVVWGEQNLKRNMEYIEKTLGKPIRDYFYRDFYDDHVRRYKKRPIYWLFTSPNRSFQALVYLHRYNRDTLNILLNDYLRPYIHKLENHIKHLNHLVVEGSAREQTRARKEIVRTEKMIEEARKYDRNVVYPLALRRIEIDLDDGVLVNYNKFGEAVKRVQSLNDPKKKAQVKKFDWIDGSEIV